MPKGFRSFCGAAALTLALAPTQAQQPAAKPDAGLPVGPATVAPHWSKYDYPKSVPEGTPYYVVEKGDTLWDLSKRFLGSPYLWPQIWNQNKYISDAHWIYPGDPLVMPKVALISDQAGAAGADAGLPEEPGGVPTGAAGGADAGSLLYPVTEEHALQCAAYVVSEKEDDSLQVVGSEEGADKVALTERDILYLNRGSNAGVKAGDVYSFHRPVYKVKHPITGKTLGTKIETSGWGRVILVTDNSASLQVEAACNDILAEDYLRPFEKQNVPLALRRPAADRLTPPSGKAAGYVVDLAEVLAAGDNTFVTIDMGSEAGLTPGNILTVYRTVYPKQPSPRKVVGELAILAVRERTATAKVVNCRDAIVAGDQVELR